jgi:hypothetical protein
MMEMNKDCQPEQELLEKLLSERDELDRHISFLQKRLGMDSADNPSTPSPNQRYIDATRTEIQKGEFYGLSRPQAAVALLRKRNKNLTTNQIFEALKESGYEGLSNRNAFNGLYTALIRSPEVAKVAPNTWGLREKYPHLKEKKQTLASPKEPRALSLEEVEGK